MVRKIFLDEKKHENNKLNNKLEIYANCLGGISIQISDSVEGHNISLSIETACQLQDELTALINQLRLNTNG